MRLCVYQQSSPEAALTVMVGAVLAVDVAV
jgi:hypothetical protein